MLKKLPLSFLLSFAIQISVVVLYQIKLGLIKLAAFNMDSVSLIFKQVTSEYETQESNYFLFPFLDVPR
jgi:hypothetical protein